MRWWSKIPAIAVVVDNKYWRCADQGNWDNKRMSWGEMRWDAIRSLSSLVDFHQSHYLLFILLLFILLWFLSSDSLLSPLWLKQEEDPHGYISLMRGAKNTFTIVIGFCSPSLSSTSSLLSTWSTLFFLGVDKEEKRGEKMECGTLNHYQSWYPQETPSFTNINISISMWCRFCEHRHHHHHERKGSKWNWKPLLKDFSSLFLSKTKNLKMMFRFSWAYFREDAGWCRKVSNDTKWRGWSEKEDRSGMM